MTELYIPSDIVGLQYKSEGASFGVDPAGDYTTIRAYGVKFVPITEYHSNTPQKVEANRGPDMSIRGRQSGTLTFSTYLRGGQGASSELATMAAFCGALSVHSNAGSAAAVLNTSTPSVLHVDDSAPGWVTHVRGDFICVGDGTPTATQIRQVTYVINRDEADCSIGITPDFAATPTTGDPVYAMDTLVPAIGAGTSCAFKVFYGTSTSSHQYLALGCGLTGLKLGTTSAGSIPIIEWTFSVNSWTSIAATTVAQSADAYTSPARPLLGAIFNIKAFDLSSAGTGAGTAYKISDIAFDFGMKVVERTATSGAQGRDQWLGNGEEPKIEFTPYFDKDLITWYDTPTAKQLHLEYVYDTDEGFGIAVPKAQFINIDPDGAINEHRSTKPEILIVDPGNSDALDESAAGVALAAGYPFPRYSFGITK